MLVASLCTLLWHVDEGGARCYTETDVAHAFAEGRLQIADPLQWPGTGGAWGDGVPVRRIGPVGETMDYRVGEEGEGARDFLRCAKASWSDGWFVAHCTDANGNLSGFAFHPASGRMLDWPQSRHVHRLGGYFYTGNRRGWQVIDDEGKVLHVLSRTPDGDSPFELVNIFMLGGSVYLSTGGAAGQSFWARCDAATGALQGTLTWPRGYPRGWSQLGNAWFFVDEHHLYRANTEDLVASVALTPLLEDTVGGTRWLWSDGTCLYLVSVAGHHLLCFDAEGRPAAPAQPLPEGWRVMGVSTPVEGWSQVWLVPADRHGDWGSAQLLTWPPASAALPTLFKAEPVQASEPEPLPGADGRHGLRIRVAAPSAEQAARHGAHHLMRWAFHVARGIIQRGARSDPQFNGVFELVCTTPEHMDPQGLPVRHLRALLGRMRATPMGYTAGDGKGLLHLRVLWRAGVDAPAECVYSSLDETVRSFS